MRSQQTLSDSPNAARCSMSIAVDDGYSAIYSTIVKESGRYVAKCRLTTSG